ncbi:DUF6602 domain-containing protein [Leptospira terpstrae]|uniref:DUF6602 domain-containing protein n=1 Tax=Leptospira terpstrae TaxID=293075 RepID=UPI003D06CAB7
MPNSIFDNLITFKIREFKDNFRNSKLLFENHRVKNKLIHAGEFGIYRENICRELLRFVFPKKYEIGSGFLINSLDENSTQCDLIIYDYENAPFIELNSNNKFIPVESVFAVGEIKSKLTKHTLTECLIKLSETKNSRKINNSFLTNTKTKAIQIFDPIRNPNQLFFTFIICESLEIDNEHISNVVNEIYGNANIPNYLRNNLLLSIEDGVLLYTSNKENSHKEICSYPIDFSDNNQEIFNSLTFIYNDTNEKAIKIFLNLITDSIQKHDFFYVQPENYIKYNS